MSETIEQARSEIDKSLSLSGFCMRRIGLSFIKPKNRSEHWKQKAMFMLSMASICYHVFGDMIYIALTLSNSPRVEDVVPLLHTFGYGALSKYLPILYTFLCPDVAIIFYMVINYLLLKLSLSIRLF